MHKHHEESLEILVNLFKEKEGVAALIFGGSVAKGMERPDSDLDAMVILTPKAYALQKEINVLSETINNMCTYKDGYFDIKYMTKDYLLEAAEKGSEPTRNSFVCSKVMFSTDPEIEDIVNRIPVFQESEREDKLLSFYSDLMLNYGYFFKCCNPSGYMRIHVINDIVYSMYRLILQENRILFPCNRRLEEAVQSCTDKPKDIVDLCQKFMDTFDEKTCDEMIHAYHSWTSFDYPKDLSTILTVYQADFEQWWMKPRPQINEW